MKLTIYLLLAFAFSLPSFAQTIVPAPADKAVVYFARPSGLGTLINFTYYDGETLIARFNGSKYFRYECEPGEHLFWARSENRSFVEADLAPGGIYIIEARPQLGGLKAQVLLTPVAPADKSISRGIKKLIARRDPETFRPDQLEKWTANSSDSTSRGLERYENLKADGRSIDVLDATMMVAPADFEIVKKKKKGE